MIGTHFSTLDWIIVITYLGATMATGLYGRKFVGGIADFLVRHGTQRKAEDVPKRRPPRAPAWPDLVAKSAKYARIEGLLVPSGTSLMEIT